MTQQLFKRQSPDSLIVINCLVDNHNTALALDTGASHTTVDLATLLIAGYELKDSIRTIQIETASGIIDAFVFKMGHLTAIGITRRNIEVCAYDFFSQQLITDFDGVLGLDFFDDLKLCIDFRASLITLQ